MTLFHLIIVSLIQGITEFLPVSSSGHLILLPNLLGLPDQGQAIDVAAHVGTLVAVVAYFRRDVWIGVRGIPAMCMGRLDAPGARLAFLLMIATIPVIVIGLALKLSGLDDQMRSIAVIGWAMLGFGIVLWWADQKSPAERTEETWALRDAIIMGFWQAVALIPGTSRSGATITGARLLGFKRTDGAKLAMLMSIPTIIASGAVAAADVWSQANAGLARDMGIVAVLSCLSALAALAIMMKLLTSTSFTPYVIYRVILGLVLLGVAYF